MNRPINLAFLGCGFATHLHSKTLAGFRDRVRCFYASRDLSRARGYRLKYNGAGDFDSYEAACKAKRIDAVFVATPPASHLELTLAALREGKHVIVEKPPFMHASDFDLVARVAAEKNKQVMVAENYFYKPLTVKLRDLLMEKVVGDVLFVHINALKKQEVTGWRGDTTLSGGGAMFEGGIHWVNLISNLGLRLQSVHGFQPQPVRDMEKSMLVALQYEEGAVGSFYYSWETPSLFKGLRISKIYGREGSITFESNGIFVIVRGRQNRVYFPGLRDIAGYKCMFQDFLAAIRQNRPPAFHLELAKRDMETIEAIYAHASHQTTMV